MWYRVASKDKEYSQDDLAVAERVAEAAEVAWNSIGPRSGQVNTVQEFDRILTSALLESLDHDSLVKSASTDDYGLYPNVQSQLKAYAPLVYRDWALKNSNAYFEEVTSETPDLTRLASQAKDSAREATLGLLDYVLHGEREFIQEDGDGVKKLF